MMPKIIPVSFYFIGNHVVLDFLNTQVISNGKWVDLLASFSDLCDWLLQAGLLDQTDLRLYHEKWNHEIEGEYVLAFAKQLRADLAEMVQQRHQIADISKHLLVSINQLLQRQVSVAQLRKEDDVFVSEQRIMFEQPRDILLPIAKAAVDFFCDNDLSRVKKCENPECVLLFNDTSKNGSRRWCSPNACGNRMKVNAYLKRQKQKKLRKNS